MTITKVLTETINIVEMIYRLLIIIGNKDITIENTLWIPYYDYFYSNFKYSEPLRDNLVSEANKSLYKLQQLNSDLLLSNLDFKTRKLIIENTCKERYMDIRIKIISEFSEEIKQFK